MPAYAASTRLSVIFQAFLHDFRGGSSPEAEKILGERRRGVSRATKYASFLVSTMAAYEFIYLVLMIFIQVLMLLRRFPILNDLPIGAIQSQGFARVAVQVHLCPEHVEHFD